MARAPGTTMGIKVFTPPSEKPLAGITQMPNGMAATLCVQLGGPDGAFALIKRPLNQAPTAQPLRPIGRAMIVSDGVPFVFPLSTHAFVPSACADSFTLTCPHTEVTSCRQPPPLLRRLPRPQCSPFSPTTVNGPMLNIVARRSCATSPTMSQKDGDEIQITAHVCYACFRIFISLPYRSISSIHLLYADQSRRRVRFERGACQRARRRHHERGANGTAPVERDTSTA